MVRINTILSEDIIEDLDRIAKDKHKTRSCLLREAAEMLIEEHKHEEEERMRQNRLKKAIEIQNRLRKKSGKWNGVAELRKWRETAK